jgi:hypothetical protein
MATANYKTIKLKKYLDIIEEYVANASITPGMLIELMSTNKVRAHATSGGNVLPMFALEDELQGKDIDDNYAAGDVVQCWIAQRGEIVQAILADGQNVAIGDLLMSNGAGYLTKYVAESWESADAQQANTLYPNIIVGIALEAQDLSALDGSNSSLTANSKYIKVRIA